jgi:hypothetical protein
MGYHDAEKTYTFEQGDMEDFQGFADFVAENIGPGAFVTFHEKPIFGDPYVQIDIRNVWDSCESYTLMMDKGQTFNIGRDEAWITGGIFDEE